LKCAPREVEPVDVNDWEKSTELREHFRERKFLIDPKYDWLNEFL